ncbi:MAG: DNA-3-methyladenine glycosylase 2 [Chloroflexota bacterium]|nr:DNA-3-methyladenine glycosylase 2 [Chloroflexota bacterium]
MNNRSLDAESCYQAVLSHDSRFDGVFFVGVSTTGIYCRTICPARTPRLESCTFHPSAAAAERAGFRPCLRCRPELAPGNAQVDMVSRLAADVAGRIEDGALTGISVAELAVEMGVSDRHLRRVLESELGVSPVELAQTQRLLLAKRLLTDTNLPVIEVAYASGFSSVTRFNALFKARYHLNPTSLRKTRSAQVPQQSLFCDLAYRPPFDWSSLLQFLGARAINGVEEVQGNRYMRTVAVGASKGWIAVEQSQSHNRLRVELSVSVAPALSQVLAQVKRLFDLAAEPNQIAAHLGELAAAHPGLRVPGAFDGFELALRAILGQLVSVKAATTLTGRFAAAFGEPVSTPFEALSHISPTAGRVATLEVEEITQLGITRSKATAIIGIARAVTTGEIKLVPGTGAEEKIMRLKELPGIGEWTAQYIAMRALSWPDAFPGTDLGIRKALGMMQPKAIEELAQSWRPWRSYAAMHLWKSLEDQQR